MKVNKKIFICALLLLAMLCAVSTASATEPLNDNLTTTDAGGVVDDGINEDLSISDVEDELSAEGETITVASDGSGDYTTISAAVGAATGGETIFIKNGEYIVDSKIDTSTKSLNFIGESNGGVIIKSTPTNTAIFETTTTDVSLKFENLVFKDSSATSAGIINFGNYESTGKLEVINCTFDNCIGKYGMIYVKTLGDAIISDVKITNSNSTVTKGANAIYVQYATNELNIKNVIIDNCNYVSSGGFSYGVIYMNAAVSNAIIDNVSISNCTGNVYGIINAKGNTVVRNSKIINNQLSAATNDIFRSNNPGTLTIEQNMIANNTCGRIFYSNQATSATTNTVLNANYNNIANNNYSSIYSGSTGCELDLESNYWGSNEIPEGISVTKWIVEDNGVYKLNTGEEIDVIIPGLNDGDEPEPEVEYDLYVDCYAPDGGDGSKTNPFNSISAAITAATGGESIFIKNGEYSESAKISLTKSLSFVGESQEGVLISLSATNTLFEMTASDVVLSFNQLTFSNINSGTGSNVPIKIGGNSNVDIVNCSFIGCSSKLGVMQLYTTGTATVSDCTIKDFKSTATGGTGGIYLSGNGIYNIKNTVIDNTQYTASSGYMYGIIYIAGKTSETTLDNVTVTNCRGAASSVIYTKAKTTVKNSKIMNNTVEVSASGYQGESVFYTNYNANNNPNAELIIEQTIIMDNVCPNNFVYANNANAKTTINYCNIQNNTIGTTFASTNGNFNFEYNYWGSNDAPTDPTVTRYAIMDDNGNFFDDQGNPLEKEIPVPSDEPGPEPVVLDVIYVSDSTGSDDNDGAISTPVKTIAKAIQLAQKGKIVILAGNYTLTETLSIAKDLDIEGRGNVLIKSSAQIISSSSKLNLTNIKFDSTANVNGAVISTTDDLTIDSCAFYANTESGSAIYVNGGNANIQNSVLINPLGYALTASSTSTVNANNNWWGNNSAANTEVEVASWIVMEASIDLVKIYPGDEVTITVAFNKTNSGTDYAGILPGFNIKIMANNLDENLSVNNNKASIKYTVNADDEARITSGSETIVLPITLYDPPEVIYVDGLNGLDTNDGDEAHPVKTIAKAIELAQKGKIIILAGSYTIENTLTVNSDLDIKGEGTVIIDGNSKRILNNNANLNITNIQFTNGFDSSAVIVNNANMTLNNTLFYSNVNLNGYGASVVRNNKKLVIDNSKFFENKERYGNIYNNNNAELFINNTEFYDNDVTTVTTVATGIALYSEGGNAVIENSKFYNNKGNFSVIYFLSKDSLSSSVVNNLTIANCTFDSNELVRYGVVYSQKANTTIKASTFTNNIVKKTNSGTNGEGAAIYVTGEKVSVETSVFKNNKADNFGNDIYVYAGELDISDSVLINENGYSIEKADSATVSANDNWWGANTPNTPITVDRWVVITVSSNDTEIETGDSITITASFDKTNDGAQYTGDLPEVFDVTFTSTSGNLNVVKAVKDKKAEVTYTVDVADKQITVSSDNALATLPIHRILDIVYVSVDGDDTNDGDRDAPVKTIAKALELAQKGQIVILPGTYSTGDLGIVDTDLNITGEGKVIIDAGNNNRVLYIYNTSKVVLKNLIFINGYTTEAADESGAILGSAGDLTIINCTFANSKSEKNGGAIYNAGHLEIIDSTFENNTADECGGAIFTQSAGIGITPSLTISNSVFRNNSANGKSKYDGGAIYVQSASSVIITNSVFEQNKATQYGGGAIEITLTETANIDGCSFISNTAVGEDYKTQSDYGGGAISFIGSYGDLKETLTVTNTLFIDNSVTDYGGGAIYTRYAKVNVANSVLINNTDVGDYSIYRRSTDVNTAKVTANDNWWGSNDDPKSNINAGTLERWAIMTINNDSEIIVGETVKLTVSINQYTTGSEEGSLANPINVSRPVTIYTNLGNIEGTLNNGEYSIDYTVPIGLKIISATVDDETQILYVVTTATNVEIDDITGLMGDRVQYTIKVTTNDGSIVNTGEVELYFDDELVATIPVLNGEAKDTVLIGLEPGIYSITAEYVDVTEEFGESESTATLNVTGIDNIVTPEIFGKFFDSEGFILDDLPFDELFFEGTFENLGVITVNKPIKLTGRNAQFKETSFKLVADDVVLNGVSIELSQSFDESDGAAIYIGGDNVTVSNNNITYNAPENEQSYAILVDVAHDAKIINNNIRYTARSEGNAETMVIKAIESDNIAIEGNVIEANIPSVPVGYSHWPAVDYYSQAIHIENSDKASVKNNDITVNYSNAEGYYDSLYALYIESSDDVNVTGNDIKLNSHAYGYGLVMDGQNLNILNNNIDVVSEGDYACGININSNSTALVDGNNISATSKAVSYPVYLDDWGVEASDITVSNNNIKGDSNCVYGIYTQGNKTNVLDNVIEVTGNYTMGITSYQTDLVVKGNKIVSNGSNVGDALSPQSSVPVETTGICAAEGSVDIQNNDIFSSGNSTIDAINTTGTIKDNKLVTADGKRGDETIKATGSTLVVDNNKSSEPPVQVIELTGKNVNMYYSDSTKYQVLVTIDGKAASGVSVKFTVNGKTKTVKTNAKGYAILTIKDNKLTPKKYTITASYEGKSVKNTLTVKQVLKSTNKKVKKSAKKLVLKATLKQGKKAIKGKKITFKFKGKTYKAKTNKKGVAKVTVKKKVIKKLKAGKKYTVKVTYLKDSIKKTVKVKK